MVLKAARRLSALGVWMDASLSLWINKSYRSNTHSTEMSFISLALKRSARQTLLLVFCCWCHVGFFIIMQDKISKQYVL